MMRAILDLANYSGTKCQCFFSTSGSRISTSGNRRALNFGEISETFEILSDFFENVGDFSERKKMKLSKTSKNDGLPYVLFGTRSAPAKSLLLGFQEKTLVETLPRSANHSFIFQ